MVPVPDGHITQHYTAQAGQHVQVWCCDVHTGTGGTAGKAMNGHINTGGVYQSVHCSVSCICRMTWDEIKM